MVKWIVVQCRKAALASRGKENKQTIRTRCAVVVGMIGLVLNLLLFVFKFLAGTMSGSVAIVADAFNSLSDGASSLLTMIGFHLAGKKPDEEHPFGHGRIEYLTGLGISVLVLFVGGELFLRSIEVLKEGSKTELSQFAILVLVVSAAVKLFMVHLYRGMAKELESTAMEATATDCFSDVFATGVVLACGLLADSVSFSLDGGAGLFVSCVILKAGVDSIGDTVNPLLGRAMNPELARELAHLVQEHSYILGVHELVYHDYGPGRAMMSFHVEVPASGDILEIHEVVDHIEREIKEKYQIETVIHMDPVVQDESIDVLRQQLESMAQEIHESVRVHDVRTVTGYGRMKVIFGVEVSHRFPMEDMTLIQRFTEELQKINEEYEPIIQVERSFVALPQLPEEETSSEGEKEETG